MVTRQQKKRRLVRGLVWLAVVGILLLVLLPLWFPWLLKPVVSRYGLTFADYDRISWSRFALTGVHGSWNGTRLQIQRVESVLPTTWLWRRFNDRPNDLPWLTLSGGHLMISGSTTNADAIVNPQPQGSTSEVLNQISQIGGTLQQWLPVAELTNCTILVASNGVTIPHAQWRAGRLNGFVRIPSARGEFEFAARLAGDSALELSAAWQAYDASLRGRFLRSTGGWRWNGELNWLTNRGELTAQFTTNGWWPARAQIDCQRWQIPSSLLPVEGYNNLVANLTANLVSNRFDLQATGLAQPTSESARKGFPTVDLSIRADGDPDGIRLHALKIQSPLLNAELTNTVSCNWTGGLLGDSAQLLVSADLGNLPGVPLTGQVQGVVRIEPQGGRSPVVRFHFAAGQVNAGPLDAKTVLIRGQFDAPVLTLEEVRADLADTSVVIAHGAFDGEAGRIVGGRWQATGGFLQKLLPGLSYAGLVASGELQGPLTNLAYRGEAAFTTCQAAGLKPFDVRARWSGQNQRLVSADIEWTAGESLLSIGSVADLDVAEREVAVKLNQLSLRRGKQEVYALQEPCAITFRAGKTNSPGELWTLGVDAFNWRGKRRTISGSAEFAWPSSGKGMLSMTNVAFVDFSDFLEAGSANVLIAGLAATAHWSKGPVHSEISAAATMTNRAGQVFGLRGSLRTDELLRIQLLALASGYTPTLSVTGTIPVKVIPEGREEMLVWDRSQSIALAGNWKDGQSETFSFPLGLHGELEISRPELRFSISGTPDEPSAELTTGAAKLAWQSKTNHSPRPGLDDFQCEVAIRPDSIRLKTFSAKLDGQLIAATGEWPFTGETWRDLRFKRKLPDWKSAWGRVELERAQVAALSVYLPEVLAPEGRLSATLELKPGKRLAGVLSLTNAATRPMGTLTPLRDIAASVRLEGDHAVLEEFRGQIGGQPVRADSFVTFRELDGSGLDYQVNLRGTNVPLARSAELLLRGDLAVSLRGGSNLPPLLSGVVALRDGLYVQHASALVWSGVRRPEWSPPYFSVTNEPFADWKLDLAVRGDRFLRTRTPVFSGIVSADFHLRGSLLAPVLTGDARVNSGRILFPFGSLAINQGFASFTGHDPNGPDLQINASGRNFRYDLQLEVKGPTDGAGVNLSSTPPLNSEQILLMLTAGEMPQSSSAISSGARAGRLGTFLGKDFLSRYLGSDPTQERLIIRTGENISQEGRFTYSVEYRLTDRWSIMGEYDEFNAFNTDLKWKIFTR